MNDGSEKGTISKERALRAFEKVTHMYAVLEMRKGRRELVAKERARGNEKLADSLFKDAENPYPNLSDRDLRSRLSKERRIYKAFWEARLSEVTLFDENCGWAPECEGLAITREGRKPIVLNNKTLGVLIFLSENHAIDYTAFCGLDAYIGDVTKLQTALHPEVRKYLIRFLDAEQIAALLHTASEDTSLGRFNAQDAHQIIQALGECEIEKLANYCITRDAVIYSLIEVIRKHGGEEGKSVIEQITEHMERISEGLQRKLNFLKGEKHE